ncbi:MAG TPA: methyltransferase [Acidimicrobiales bacterium]|nr:methyltransferase [Acidimicrobiales bacterium]
MTEYADTPGAEGALRRLSERVKIVELVRSDSTSGAPQISVLVEPGRWVETRTMLDAEEWRYRLGGEGIWRRVPVMSWMWPDSSQLFIHRHVAVGPLPSRWYRALSAELWSTSRGGVPDRVTAALYLAVQGLRPGRYHDDSREGFNKAVAAGEVAHSELLEVASRIRFRHAAEAALAAIETKRWQGSPAPDGRETFARVLLAVNRRLRPAHLRDLLAGTPRIGMAPLRARLAGVETATPPAVFTPTPDVETLVDMVLDEVPADRNDVVVDCGAGVGAIALGVAAARPRSDVHALELSRWAARACRRNVRRSGLRHVQVRRGSLLEPLPPDVKGRVRVLVANLPFYPATEYAPIGGVARATIQGTDDDGLGLYRLLLRQAAPIMAADSMLVLQMFADQWPTLAGDLERLGYVQEGARTSGPFVLGRAVRRPGG